MTFVAERGACTSTSLSANGAGGKPDECRKRPPPHTNPFTASMNRIRLIGLET